MNHPPTHLHNTNVMIKQIMMTTTVKEILPANPSTDPFSSFKSSTGGTATVFGPSLGSPENKTDLLMVSDCKGPHQAACNRGPPFCTLRLILQLWVYPVTQWTRATLTRKEIEPYPMRPNQAKRERDKNNHTYNKNMQPTNTSI